jgi:hypothetical protein
MARLRRAGEDGYDALVDAAKPGIERAVMLSGILGLRVEKIRAARYAR